MTSLIRVAAAVTLALAFGLAGLGGTHATAAEEHILVQASGLDDGTTTRDSVRITGTSAANVIRITEGINCDSRLCYLKVEGESYVEPQGACKRQLEISLFPGDDKVVYCAYFGDLSSPDKTVRVDLGGGSDDIWVTQRSNVLWHWTIDFGAGNETIFADRYHFPENYPRPLTIYGGDGSDRFDGTWPNSRIELWGDDEAVNHTGNDWFTNVDGAAAMTIHGNGGDDVVTTLQGLRFDGGPGSDSLTPLTGMSGRLTLDGGPGNDTLKGSSLPDEIKGGDGNDTVTPRGGTDTVDLGAGDDRLLLDSGLDTLYETFVGGAGRDRVVYGGSAPLLVHLDGVHQSTGHDVLQGFEDVTGGAGADHIVGNDSANRIDGGGGIGDRIETFGGDDTIDVQDARSLTGRTTPDDVVEAGAGADTIYSDDGRPDSIACGTSTHTQTAVINGHQTQIQVPDIDRVDKDVVDSATACEQAL
jgi:Ca2+-binding RTX toxin-like protein